MFKTKRKRSMAKFRVYDPGQAWLLPPNVRDVLGEEHLSFFVHEVVERLNVKALEDGYSEEGQPGYHPRLLLKLWLYAYCLGITSSRRLEQRTREDLGFRYLAAESVPDFWTLNAFRRRHAKALNDCSHRFWSGPGSRAGDGWVTWPSIPPGSRRMLRAIV